MQLYSFGAWLKRNRKALDLTQAELGGRVGCSAAAIRKIEAEERRPSAQIIERLAELFNVPTTERASFHKFARGDWKSAPGAIIHDRPWQASTPSPRSTLPAPTSSLIGREDDIALVREYLSKDNIRLVTLTGPPGIGKTRLGIEASRATLLNFPNGVFFVALAPLDEPASIAPVVAQSLGFVAAKNISTMDQLKEGIGEKHILLVLDNCEHLIDDIASLASGLLFACPHLKILATSRESLRIPGEWQHAVPVLDTPKENQSITLDGIAKFSALALFAERARAVRSDFALNPENIQTIVKICAHLDGLPLAIELIAARMRVMSPEALLMRLHNPFILSADGMRALSPRQKTLNNAIGWSYDLLSQEEQYLFARLSAFSGGFTMEAAEAIFSVTIQEKPVSDLIGQLLDKSLLQRVQDERGNIRISMLATIREFAQERSRDMGWETESCNRHLTYFLELAENADKEIHGPDQLAWIDQLTLEHDNFRAALEWCITTQQTESALRLMGALGWSWLVRDRFSEMQNWFDKIRTLPAISEYPALYARVLNYVGNQSWLSGDLHHARSILEESQTIWLRLGTDGEQGLAEVLHYLGFIDWTSADVTAQRLFERSLELYRKHGNLWGMAYVSVNLAIDASERNEDVFALSLFEHSLEAFHQLGDLWGIARTSQWLGQHFLKLKNYGKAHFFFSQHLAIDEDLHFMEGTTNALANLGVLARHQGDEDQAELFYQKMLAISRECGSRWSESNAYYGLGMTALHRNQYEQAAGYFRDYHRLHRTISEEAASLDLLFGLAAVAAGIYQPQRSAKLYGAAQAFFEVTPFQIPPFDQAEFDRHIQIAREQLGKARFEVLAAEGRAMSMEQAVAYALEEVSK